MDDEPEEIEPISTYDIRAVRDRRIILPIVGCWLLLSPLLFHYWRSASGASDMLCGGLLVLLGFLLSPKPSSAAFEPSMVVGAWLVFAPMLIPSVTSVFFLTDIPAAFVVMAVSTRPMDPEYWRKRNEAHRRDGDRR
jgi:hypothetical protein